MSNIPKRILLPIDTTLLLTAYTQAQTSLPRPENVAVRQLYSKNLSRLRIFLHSTLNG